MAARWLVLSRVLLAVMFVQFVLAGYVFPQDYVRPDQKKQHEKKQDKNGVAETTAPPFTDADAVRVLSDLRQALEAHHQSQFLKAFDSKKMASYAAFREQISEFFGKYESFRVRYQLVQAATESENGIVLADFEMEATPSGANLPNVRKHTQLRPVLAWNGKQWKIVDLRPRDFFS